jgi:hypothetical protein
MTPEKEYINKKVIEEYKDWLISEIKNIEDNKDLYWAVVAYSNAGKKILEVLNK